ncbi:MAG: 1-deoxy-D-xylulose-5-phosphate reductoisomerase [bacterium]|jgi:1-deoxy-D-xylulose-5-phosphate reductoisomerase
MSKIRVAVFGSTGSVGRSALEVIAHLSARLKLVAIACQRSVAVVCAQAERYRVPVVGVSDPEAGAAVQKQLGRKYQVLAGYQGLEEYSRVGDYDLLVMAMAGTGGLDVVLNALRRGKRVALASKELLVAYGEAIMGICRRYRAAILPVDSELAAIHQCLDNRGVANVRRVILTASGGPFWRQGPPPDASRAQVLRHPTWRMGRKITVDSATLMNKGLEVIETVRLFGLKPEQVETVIHPESIVHSMVEFRDGSILAQLSVPDMRLPIQYALTYPERLDSLVSPLSFERCRELRFVPVERHRFPCLDLAYQALQAGSAGTTALNAANEVAVNAFLAGKIAFGMIPDIIKSALEIFAPKKPKKYQLSELRQLEARVTDFARAVIAGNRRG